MEDACRWKNGTCGKTIVSTVLDTIIIKNVTGNENKFEKANFRKLLFLTSHFSHSFIKNRTQKSQKVITVSAYHHLCKHKRRLLLQAERFPV
jgi:hypothetical protein